MKKPPTKTTPKNFIDRIGSGIDRAIGIFNPDAELRRRRARLANDFMSSVGGYKGADTGRLRSNWNPGYGSADADILWDLQKLRSRSRDLNRNDANAAGVTLTLVANDVGTGIRPQACLDHEALGMDEKTARRLEKQCELVFQMWSDSADAAEKKNFYQLQRLVDRKVYEDGEVLVLPLMLKQPTGVLSLALDIIEADRLETPGGITVSGDIRNGVKIGRRGEPITYFIRKTHPGDVVSGGGWNRYEYAEIPARNAAGRKNVLHIFDQDRPGQTRGVPFLAPVIPLFKDLGEYMESELVAARVSACIAMLVETPDLTNMLTGHTTTSQQDSNGNTERLREMEPGLTEYLRPGEKISSFNPTRPVNSFDAFTVRMLRAIAAGIGLPYEIVAKDFSRTNYSSARSALLQAYRLFKMRQQFLTWEFNQPVYEWVIEEAWLRGMLDMPDFYAKRYLYTRCKWLPPGWAWVDPMKEAQSAEIAVRNGFSTLAQECGARGDSWEEVMEQRAREERTRLELEKKYGVSLKVDASTKPNVDPPPDPEDPDKAPGEGES